jgi:succinoglycan biosynthesis protein ExoA
MKDLTTPFVTLVIPVLNEERFILPLLHSLGCLGGNRCLPGPYEIIVVDGGSTDGTLDILDEVAKDAGIRVIHNPLRIQSAGVNLAAKEANPAAKYLIRVDAHAVYDPGFIGRVLRSLEDTGASSVVVPLITRPAEGAKGFVWAVTLAQRSKLGNGGSAHRLESTPAKWVDHGHHAGFDIEFFRSLGGYDESFETNEDAEYDVRVHKAGGRIWFEPSALVWYSPRETAVALARQYYRYGKGRASTILKHRLLPKPRQMFPVLALAANTTALLGSLFWLPALFVPVVYFVACYLAAISGKKNLMTSDHGHVGEEATCALMIMHMCWGAGFISRLFNGLR